MLVSPTDPALELFDPFEVTNGRLPDHLQAHRERAASVVEWARLYLCRHHAALGRDGPVCPYTEPSLERSLFRLAIYVGSDPALDEVCAIVTKYRDWFLHLEPVSSKDAELKVILILFPDIAAHRAAGVIDRVQSTLKPTFTAAGLMIGQFHPWCDEPAVWNLDFRPLRSPVPLLAIRNMVRTDAPFLTNDAISLSAYLARFGHDVPARLQAKVLDAARAHGLSFDSRSEEAPRQEESRDQDPVIGQRARSSRKQPKR